MSQLTNTYELLHKRDKAAVQVLYERYGKKLYSYAIRQWNMQEDDAWELIYKTLYRILDSHANYQFASEKKFGAFVFTTFINYLRNFYRDQKLREIPTQSLDELNVQVSADEQEEKPVQASMLLLREELDLLEDWERMLLLLRMQDMPYSEIAKLIGKPETQLKVYFQRVRKKLTDRLQQKITIQHPTT